MANINNMEITITCAVKSELGQGGNTFLFVIPAAPPAIPGHNNRDRPVTNNNDRRKGQYNSNLLSTNPPHSGRIPGIRNCHHNPHRSCWHAPFIRQLRYCDPHPYPMLPGSRCEVRPLSQHVRYLHWQEITSSLMGNCRTEIPHDDFRADWDPIKVLEERAPDAGVPCAGPGGHGAPRNFLAKRSMKCF
jgi:hypothetical protein